jgi:hypothetical protein
VSSPRRTARTGITHERFGIPWAEKWPSMGILLECRKSDIRAKRWIAKGMRARSLRRWIGHESYSAPAGRSFLRSDQHRSLERQSDENDSEKRPRPILEWMQEPKKEYRGGINSHCVVSHRTRRRFYPCEGRSPDDAERDPGYLIFPPPMQGSHMPLSQVKLTLPVWIEADSILPGKDRPRPPAPLPATQGSDRWSRPERNRSTVTWNHPTIS